MRDDSDEARRRDQGQDDGGNGSVAGTAELDDLLQRAYAVDGPDDSRELYAAWAETYESGFTEPNQYIFDKVIVQRFMRDIDTIDGAVLDAGCGTGLVGAQLSAAGIKPIDGLDLSPEMLGQAALKRAPDGTPAYRHLIEADLTATLDIASGTYAAVITAGTFTHGHVGPEAVAELLRVAQTGAHCAFGVNGSFYEKSNFGSWFERYASEGVITNLEIVKCPVYVTPDPSNLNHFSQVATFNTC